MLSTSALDAHPLTLPQRLHNSIVPSCVAHVTSSHGPIVQQPVYQMCSPTPSAILSCRGGGGRAFEKPGKQGRSPSTEPVQRRGHHMMCEQVRPELVPVRACGQLLAVWRAGWLSRRLCGGRQAGQEEGAPAGVCAVRWGILPVTAGYPDLPQPMLLALRSKCSSHKPTGF